MRRDERNDQSLIKLGWVPIHFWEKDILKNLDYCTPVILDYIAQKKRSRLPLFYDIKSCTCSFI